MVVMKHEGVLLPLEERRVLAHHTLADAWSKLQEIPDGDLAMLEREQAKFEVRKADLSPVGLEILTSMHERNAESVRKSSEAIVALTWDGVIGICCITFGDDATRFALERMKKTTRGN